MADAEMALAVLDGLLTEFPFVGGQDGQGKSVALSMLMTPVLRGGLPPAVPIHLVSKPAPGSGGSYLADRARNQARISGVVLFYRLDDGYGFARRDDGGSIFVSYRELSGVPGRVLGAGDRVSFVVGADRAGRTTAVEVEPVEQRSDPAVTVVQDGRRRYETRVMTAKDALRQRAERLWTHGGMDDV